MPNIKNADCGFNPDDFGHFYIVEASALKAADGFDLTAHRNMRVDLSKENADLQIADFNCMVNGAHYTLVAVNGAATKNQIKFPSKTTLYSEDIVAENGMTVVYNFFTDGYSIYCERAIYA